MAGPLAGRRAVRYARRAWPFVLAAYRRWERLTPEEKARYQKAVRDAAERGRRVVTERRPGAGGKGASKGRKGGGKGRKGS
ncbi:MAG: hypothetical protein ACJ768_03725 [Gaiellaceae bacterium]